MNSTLTPHEVKRVLETALLASPSPMPLPDLRRLFDEEVGSDTIRRLLEELRDDWTDRGVELAQLSTGWRFQTRPEIQRYLERVSEEKAPKYSRAVMETLAIIAYRQPVSRGDVEDIRGVVVSPNIIRTLEERGWIDVVGHRETPGRPALYATTKAFLDDLGLRSLQELPPLEEIARSAEVSPDLLATAGGGIASAGTGSPPVVAQAVDEVEEFPGEPRDELDATEAADDAQARAADDHGAAGGATGAAGKNGTPRLGQERADQDHVAGGARDTEARIGDETAAGEHEAAEPAARPKPDSRKPH